MTLLVAQLNHFTLTCAPADLESLRDFYAGALGLVEGPRPEFSFPGHWLYSDGQPIVHLAGLRVERPAAETGPLDHIAFSGVDVERTRQRLRELRIAFDELPVPGYPLYQIFFKDPQGLKIELTFRTEEST